MVRFGTQLYTTHNEDIDQPIEASPLRIASSPQAVTPPFFQVRHNSVFRLPFDPVWSSPYWFGRVSCFLHFSKHDQFSACYWYHSYNFTMSSHPFWTGIIPPVQHSSIPSTRSDDLIGPRQRYHQDNNQISSVIPRPPSGFGRVLFRRLLFFLNTIKLDVPSLSTTNIRQQPDLGVDNSIDTIVDKLVRSPR